MDINIISFFYFVIGLLWTISMSPLWALNAEPSKKAKRLTIVLNVFLWPLCVLVYFINKITGRPTLF